MKTIEGKLYPNKKEIAILNKMLEDCRVLYNKVLETKIEAYKKDKKKISRYDLQTIFKGQKDIPATLTQMVIYRVNNSFERFFKKNSDFPRFKSENRYRSIELRTHSEDYRIKNGKLYVWGKFGLNRGIKIRGLQELIEPSMGRIVKRASGWYLQVCVETAKVKPKKVRTAIGIDVGLKAFLVDSDNKSVKPPKFFVNTQIILAQAQRRLSKGKKGGVRRNEKRRIVARIHEKINNQRKDFLHKLSRQYADQYDLVAVENLNIKGMVRNRHLSKAIVDASWGSFTTMLGYKLRMLGRHLVEVNPRFTTQKCSECGELVQKSLSVRTHICNCGYIADRDHNAARNILTAGLGQANGEGIAIATSLTRKIRFV